MTTLKETLVNDRWSIFLPEHRAIRPHWGEWTNDEGETYFGWEVARLDSMHKNIRPGDVVVDVGTEEGDISGLISQWGGELVLTEPNGLAWPCIKAIWEGNSLKPPLICWEGFVGHITSVEWSPSTNWPESSFGSMIHDHGFCNLGERPDIPSVRMDDLVEDAGIVPDIITIDVEGSELRVLEGAQETLRRFRPLVYVSIHEAFMFNQYNESPIKLLWLLREQGYEYTLLDYDHELHLAAWATHGRKLVR